ncbi:MAG TPA: hypothetical protein VF188_03405 [Longimicrobiales bacterium]
MSRRTLAFTLVLLIASLNIAVPLLDRQQGHAVPAFTAPGGDAGCVLGHDHGICTQYGANPWVSSSAPQARERPEIHIPVVVAAARLSPRLVLFSRPQSRAPPSR